MGIFGANGPQDGSLAALLTETGPEGWRKKNALKAVATCEPTLQQLRSTEGLLILAHDCSPTQVSARLVAVTNQSVMAVTKKGIDRQFRFVEIAETRLGQVDRGVLVMVDTHKAVNDFRPDDSRRMAYCIDFQVATPGAANAGLCLHRPEPLTQRASRHGGDEWHSGSASGLRWTGSVPRNSRRLAAGSSSRNKAASTRPGSTTWCCR